MKKRLVSMVFLVCLLFSISTNVCATDMPQEDGIDSGMDYFRLKELFPDIPLREDGYVEGYSENDQSIKSRDSSLNSEPVETYTAQYENGICHLNIYSDGFYAVYGREKITDIPVPRDVGYTEGATYKSYYNVINLGVKVGFSYTYNVYLTGGKYSQISNLSGTSPYGGAQQMYFEAGSSTYVRQVQSAYAAAEVYGLSMLYTSNGIKSGNFKLTTTVSYGTVDVNIVVL